MVEHLSLAAIADAYGAGETPAALLGRCRENIAADAAFNAWIYVISEAELAAYIAALESRPRGPLWGVPFAVKDNIDVAGLPTTAGCDAFAYTPTTSAPVVAALVEAGAIPLGKTHLDQFATGLVGTRAFSGPCLNSVDPA
jgi:allophanate hydrolase